MRGEDGNLLVLDIASVLCGPNKCFISIAFKSKHKHCRLPGLLCFQTFSSNFLKTQKTKSTVLLGRYRTFHEQLTSSIFVCLSGSRYMYIYILIIVGSKHIGSKNMEDIWNTYPDAQCMAYLPTFG